ncbi:EamA domain-containing protein OS=Streptomyces glaucescens OX=1907 GN=SGLAU_26850 PE=4 SV=1 [Streptomyces glaucescens]
MIFTPLAESAVTRTLPSRGFLAAAAVSVLGVVLLTQSGGFTRPSLGDLLMLLAALALTVHVLAMSRVKSVQGAPALPLTTVQLGASVVVFALLSAVLHHAVGHRGDVRRAGVGGAAVPVRVLHAVRLLRADVGRAPHLPVPGQPAAGHRTALGRSGRDRARRELGPVVGLAGGALVLAGTAWGRRAAG